MAKQPSARWPSAAALAALARQAAAALGAPMQPGGSVGAPPLPVSGPQPGVPAQPGHPRPPVSPAAPVAGTATPRVAPGATQVAPPYNPPGAPRPAAAAAAPVARPSAGAANYTRGAASVSPAVPQPATGYAYSRPAASPVAQPDGNRSLLIVSAIVIGLLVMICSGVLSYQYWENRDNSSMSTTRTAASGPQYGDGRDVARGAPYRQMERIGYPGGVTR